MTRVLNKRAILLVSVLALIFLAAAVSTSAAADSTPVIQSFSPADGATVTTDTTVSFTVVDPDLILNSDYYIKIGETIIPSTLQYRGHMVEDTCSGDLYWVTDGYETATISGAAVFKDGPQTVEVGAKDRLGNLVTTSWTVSGAVKPNFSDLSPANASLTGNNTTISVKVTDNSQVDPATIALRIDDSLPVQHSFDPVTGLVSYTANPPLIDGLHTVSISASDMAGNQTSTSWGFNVKTNGPWMTFADAGKTLTTASPAFSIWTQSDVNLDSGSATLAVDGVPVTADFEYKGHWDYPMELDPVYIIDSRTEASISGTVSGLTDGPHTLTVSARDYLGNTTTTSWDFTVNAFPIFSAPTPADKADTTANQGFSVKVADNDAIDSTSVAVYYDGGLVPASFDLATGVIGYQPPGGIPDGPHSVKAYATDTTGNVSIFNWTFTVQTVGPELTFANDGQVFNTYQPTITVSLKSNVKILDTDTVMTIDGQPVERSFTYKGHWDYPMELDPEWAIDSYHEGTLGYIPPTINDGTHVLAVSTKDILGNTSSQSWELVIAQAPVLSGMEPVNGTTITSKTPTIKAVITDPNGPSVDTASIRLLIDNKQVTPVLTDDGGTINLTYTSPVLADDSYHNVSLSAADSAAQPNTATASWRFYINTKGEMPINAQSCSSCHTLNEYNKYVHTEGPLGIGVGHSSPTHFSGNGCDHCHGGYKPQTCGYCHNGDVSLWWDGDGWVGNEPVPDPTIAAGQDCLYCHSGNSGGWIPSEYRANHYYWVNNMINTGVEPFKPLYSDLYYILRHDILPLHQIEKGSCNECHSTYLTREHNRTNSAGVQMDCNTCHKSTNPAVQQAIASKNRDCSACHAAGDHEVVHTGGLDASCQTCHKDTLSQEHLSNTTTAGNNYSCDTCHASTNKEVKRTITANNLDCAACHRQGHNVSFADKVPADIPLYTGYSWAVPIEASLFAGELTTPVGYDDGQVVLSNRRADVTVDQIWSFYNQQLTAQGWTVKSGAPAAGAQSFTVELEKAGRFVTVKCYNTETGAGTGQPVTSGYRIEIWYK